MSATPQVNAYLRFMKWFSETHPELHRRYWQYFTAPKSGNNEVAVKGIDLDAGIFADLVQYNTITIIPVPKKRRSSGMNNFLLNQADGIIV